MANLNSLFDQIMTGLSGQGGSSAPGRAGPAGGIAGIGKSLEGMMGDKGSFTKGAVAGGLVGALLGGKGVAKAGAAAAIGTLAYRAYKDWQAGQAPLSAGTSAPETAALSAPEGSVFLPAPGVAQDALAEKLVRAMVAAAKADGEVSTDEQAAISRQLAERGIGAEARGVIEQELGAALDVGRIAKLAASPEEAAEIYAASLLAVAPANAAEKGYLAMLAARMDLAPELVEHLHGQVGVPV